jgi:hypothetical protein
MHTSIHATACSRRYGRGHTGDVAVAVSGCVAVAWLCERKVVPKAEEVKQ